MKQVQQPQMTPFGGPSLQRSNSLGLGAPSATPPYGQTPTWSNNGFSSIPTGAVNTWQQPQQHQQSQFQPFQQQQQSWSLPKPNGPMRSTSNFTSPSQTGFGTGGGGFARPQTGFGQNASSSSSTFGATNTSYNWAGAPTGANTQPFGQNKSFSTGFSSVRPMPGSSTNTWSSWNQGAGAGNSTMNTNTSAGWASVNANTFKPSLTSSWSTPATGMNAWASQNAFEGFRLQSQTTMTGASPFSQAPLNGQTGLQSNTNMGWGGAAVNTLPSWNTPAVPGTTPAWGGLGQQAQPLATPFHPSGFGLGGQQQLNRFPQQTQFFTAPAPSQFQPYVPSTFQPQAGISFQNNQVFVQEATVQTEILPMGYLGALVGELNRRVQGNGLDQPQNQWVEEEEDGADAEGSDGQKEVNVAEEVYMEDVEMPLPYFREGHGR